MYIPFGLLLFAALLALAVSGYREAKQRATGR